MGEDGNVIAELLRDFIRNVERIAKRYERMRGEEGEEWKDRNEGDEGGEEGHESLER